MNVPVRRRLFFALWPGDAERAGFAAHLDDAPSVGGRAMRADNLHLTLAFIGDVEVARLSCLERAGAAAARVAAPCPMIFDRLGLFPEARVLWAGMSRIPPELCLLQSAVAREVAERCGFTLDPRPFVPHLTLRRAVDASRAVILPLMAPLAWRADALALVESSREADGVVYRPILYWPLAGC
ncbi:MAG: RNA 2',3'-cyclic phosphodiesterase [Pseudomonadota bacterium]